MKYTAAVVILIVASIAVTNAFPQYGGGGGRRGYGGGRGGHGHGHGHHHGGGGKNLNKINQKIFWNFFF